jgi:hypothetical protein
MLKRMLAASGSSSSIGVVGSVIIVSCTERLPSPQLGTSSWVLDSRASFHRTSDFAALSSLHSIEFPLNVLTADVTSLSVASRDTLSTPSCFVPDVSHVFLLILNLFFAAQITDSSCHFILDVDSCSI